MVIENNGVNEMNKQTLNAAIGKVAKATDKTKAEIAAKMFAKDQWTWFLIRQAA